MCNPLFSRSGWLILEGRSILCHRVDKGPPPKGATQTVNVEGLGTNGNKWIVYAPQQCLLGDGGFGSSFARWPYQPCVFRVSSPYKSCTLVVIFPSQTSPILLLKVINVVQMKLPIDYPQCRCRGARQSQIVVALRSVMRHCIYTCLCDSTSL